MINTADITVDNAPGHLATQESTPAITAAASAGQPSEARLTLGFTDDAGTTRLTDRRHFGPLRVQKALYPEHPSVCHAVIIHPPGGVVGGDQLRIAVDCGAQAAALITTPGAAKWYKANGHISRQHVNLAVGAGASIEWLPQETIFFNQAHVMLDHHVSLAAEARYIGVEILCFGRTASGEKFRQGRIGQHTTIRRDGKLLWWEQGTLDADSGDMQSMLALGGYTVCATLIAVGAAGDKPFPSELLASLRKLGKPDPREGLGEREEPVSRMSGDSRGLHIAEDPTARAGVTQIKNLLVARYLGHSSAAARSWTSAAWQQIRPALTGRAASVPRIWHT
jgi:urease accessory protein